MSPTVKGFRLLLPFVCPLYEVGFAICVDNGRCAPPTNDLGPPQCLIIMSLTSFMVLKVFHKSCPSSRHYSLYF